MAAEIVVAALGAAASLGAGLVKQIFTRKRQESDHVTVTVQRGTEKIEMEGTMGPEESSRVLEMVQHPHASAR